MTAPVLLMLLMGTVDFGRVIYYYTTINQAATEAARVTVRDSPVLPKDADVVSALQRRAVTLSLGDPCPNGPILNTVPSPNTGVIYITEPGASSTVETTQPDPMNAPGGEPSRPTYTSATGQQCSAVNPASGHMPLTVTVVFNFVPVTPLLQQIAANHIILKTSVTYRTEY